MSQTARDVITRAMRLLGVIIAGNAPTTPEANNGLLALNAMLHGWKGQGVDIGHIDLTLNDNVDVADQFLNGCTAMLAVELSPEYGVPIPQAVGIAASNGWSAICAEYKENDIARDVTSDLGLRRLSANRSRGGWYTG